MTEIESIMEQHCDVQAVRTLFVAYSALLQSMRGFAGRLREVGFAHEADCLDSQARSAEQAYARMMRERVKMEGPEALRERDEARAALTAETANANAYAHQRDEARAEVERLKAELAYARSPEGRASL